VIAVDTSVVVAAFATWHERHSAARTVVDKGARLVAHCGFESYSVLTRLPPPHRAAPEIIQEFLKARFGSPWLMLSAADAEALVPALVANGIRGGATYDAIVARTARAAGATLATCDVRAVRTYELLGVRFRIVE
jgi:predicted nucleic acid-binding protein